ncbi:aminoglycoside phosphotransferase family protein [Sinomonas sp. RB5]
MTLSGIVPDALLRRCLRSPGGRAWLDAVPGLLAARLAAWGLTPDLVPGSAAHAGMWALVVPVRRVKERLALKLSRPFPEAASEAPALRLWGGRAAVRLVDEDAESSALLLERLDAGRRLQDVPFPEAAQIWGALLRELSIAPDDRPGWDRFERIDAMAERWSDELPERWERLGRPFPRWLLEAGLELAFTRGAVGRRGGRDVLVHTDLHGLNVLAVPEGEPAASDGGPSFRAIDPQASLGEGEFAVAPMLWNRLPELAGADAPAALAERCSLLAREAGLEEEAARGWAVLREVENALWYAERPGHGGDLERSLWVASALCARLLPGLPAVEDLARLG